MYIYIYIFVYIYREREREGEKEREGETWSARVRSGNIAASVVLPNSNLRVPSIDLSGCLGL